MAEWRARFVLVVDESGTTALHALAPGEIARPSLCGRVHPHGGWRLNGFTSNVDRIGCQGCRERAAQVVR